MPRVSDTRSHSRKGRRGDQSMRGSHIKDGELESVTYEVTLGKIA
jgi:hypothetical protein